MHKNAIAAALILCALSACSPAEAPKAEAPPADAPAAQTAAATNETAMVVVASPQANARVTSPLVVEGAAPGDWYFEAVFPAKLVGADGAVLAEAPAQAQSNWMTEAPVTYRAELTFTVTQDTPATLVLQEDMPADNRAPREVTIPVVLTPR